jgi:hypothetical protein
MKKQKPSKKIPLNFLPNLRKAKSYKCITDSVNCAFFAQYANYIVRRKDNESINYNSFTLRKKEKSREITAPVKELKGVQTDLKNVLTKIYKPNPCVHGFTKKKSILTNAKEHLNKKYVLNIDIENFYDSIHFGMVRGMFMAEPYNLPNIVATLFTKVACFNNSLATGSPCSPIISNMVTDYLDKRIIKYINNINNKDITYTRYADDITISFNEKKYMYYFYNIKNKQLNAHFEEKFTLSDFKIKQSKTRIQLDTQCQKVTGLICNEKVNVSKKYISELKHLIYIFSKEPDIEKRKNLEGQISGKLGFAYTVKKMSFTNEGKEKILRNLLYKYNLARINNHSKNNEHTIIIEGASDRLFYNSAYKYLYKKKTNIFIKILGWENSSGTSVINSFFETLQNKKHQIEKPILILLDDDTNNDNEKSGHKVCKIINEANYENVKAMTTTPYKYLEEITEIKRKKPKNLLLALENSSYNKEKTNHIFQLILDELKKQI